MLLTHRPGRSDVCVYACVSGRFGPRVCSILWQQPVKMFHLSSGDPFVLCACMSTSMFVCICQHPCVSEGDGWVCSAYVSFLLPRL